MPRIYDNPKEKPERRWESRERRPTPGNGPAGPLAQTDNRVNFVLIAIALALALITVLVARG